MRGVLRGKEVRRAQARAPSFRPTEPSLRPTLCHIYSNLPVNTPPFRLEVKIFSHPADSASHERHTERIRSKSHFLCPRDKRGFI